MFNQLTLGIRFLDKASFANFYPGDNAEAVSTLKAFFTPQGMNYVYLWGSGAVGKSHLLQATCKLASSLHLSPFYLSLNNKSVMNEAILENLDDYSLVCIDDVMHIAGIRSWEEALFHLFNRCQQAGSKLLVAGCNRIQELGFQLPDLVSRLASGISYHLKPLSDEQKLIALQLRAELRGMVLSEEVGRYLLNHYPRDLKALFDCLEMLDNASMEAKHKLTIPFVKTALKG